MLVDSYGRVIDYLRISLTQSCNFRCLYCMPKLPFDYELDEKLLSFEELFLFVKLAIDEGVKKIRLTGGEPLLRKDLHLFIKMIKDYAPKIDLALTTNGFLLKNLALNLKNAGLERINISLDTLNSKKAKKIAQKDVLDEVLAGIEAALKCDLKVKLNCVVLKGFNDDELLDLLHFAKNKNIQIRFIEFMENHHAYGQLKGLNSGEILQILSTKYRIENATKSPHSPSKLFRLDDGYMFGIIDPHSSEFCESCNRIRLSAEGLLIPCLYYDEALSIRKAVRNKDINAALAVLKNVLQNKPEKNKWERGKQNEVSARAFYQTGG